MKKNLLITILVFFGLFALPKINFGQSINLGTAANFALFTSVGAVTNSGTGYLTHVTGNVGTNSDPTIPGFGNVDGRMHYVSDPASANGATDVLSTYNQLNAKSPTFFPANLLGNGQILVPGVYSISGATSLNLDLTFDALADPTAEFIIQIQGPFAANTNAKIKLINNAKACNIYWKIDGAVDLAAGVSFKGTIVSNAAITLAVNDTLEGRALTNNGLISVGQDLIYTPIGCGSPVLTGPSAPALGAAECYAIFSSDGPVTDDGLSIVGGDIGTNNGSVTGYNPLFVDGDIHSQDGSTIACMNDLGTAYTYLNTLQEDIELLFPAQFGHNLVLTPHTYLMNGAVTFTDSLYLDAQDNVDAVFVIKVYGAFSTSTYSKVILINGAQAKNVYWMVNNGALSINNYSVFNGTIVVNNGAVNLLLGSKINGRVFTTVGAINTYSDTVVITSGKASAAGIISGQSDVCAGETGVVYSVPAISGASGYIWTLPSGASIVSGNNTNSITVDFDLNAVNGNITVQGTGSCSNGIISSDFPVNIKPIPSVNSVPNQSLCGNATSNSVQFSGGPVGTTYDWTNDQLSINLAANGSGDINSFTVINSGSTDVIATITVTPTNNGCIGANTFFTITVKPTPIASASSNSPVCSGNALILSAQSVNGASYTWTGPNGYTSNSKDSTILISTFLNEGAYSLKITKNGCESIASVTNVVINNCAVDVDLSIVKTANTLKPIIGAIIEFTITAKNNGPVDASNVIVSDKLETGYTFISASTSKGTFLSDSGKWMIGSMINGSTETMTIKATVNSSGNYTNSASIKGDEADPIIENNISTIFLNAVDFHIPEGFSPNGDQINDLFVIRGIQNFQNNSISIFNRWGDKIFEGKPYINDWNGKLKVGQQSSNEELPVGTYFYTLDLGDGSEIYKGTIYLNR